MKTINEGIYKWKDQPVKHGDIRESRKILEGGTSHLEYLKIHATTLNLK